MDVDGVAPASEKKKKKLWTNKEKRAALKTRHRKVKNMVAFPVKKRDPRRRGPRI
jgi:hypothetical protein